MPTSHCQPNSPIVASEVAHDTVGMHLQDCQYLLVLRGRTSLRQLIARLSALQLAVRDLVRDVWNITPQMSERLRRALQEPAGS